MENSYLNVAHVYGRKAEHYAKHRRFDEAIDSHRKAVTNLDEALKISPASTVVLESLQLQRKYHLKQVEFLRHKKQQHERYMKALEYQRRRNPEYLTQQMEKIDKYNELQLAIYHNLDDTDVLLESLSKARGQQHDAPPAGKAPAAVEQLVSLNHSLHVLIHKMAQNCDEYATENEALKEKLSLYQREKDLHPVASGAAAKGSKGERGLTLDAGRDNREEIGLHSPELPALAPLELPSFEGFENN